MADRHQWDAWRVGDGTSAWACNCGRSGDDYLSLDAAEDAAELHVDQEG